MVEPACDVYTESLAVRGGGACQQIQSYKVWFMR